MHRLHDMHYWFRSTLMPTLIAPMLRLIGYRFDKSWRWGETSSKQFVYSWLCCTFIANIKADHLFPSEE